MQRPSKSTVDALLELLDTQGLAEAERLLAVILARQAERSEGRRRAA